MKGEIKITTIVLLLLIFSGVIMGMATFYSDIGAKYNVDAQNLTSMSVANDILEKSKQARTALGENPFTGIPVIGGFIDFFYVGITSVWSSVNIFAGSISLAQNTINETATMLYIPGWAIGLFMAIITIVVVVALASLIAGREV